MTELARSFLEGFNWFVIFYFCLWNGSYFLFILIAFGEIASYAKEVRSVSFRKLFRSIFYKPISVIVPAYNEAAGVAVMAHSALSLEYPEFEVLVVNDGSSDHTLEALKGEFELAAAPREVHDQLPCEPIRKVYVSRLYPNLVVIDKEHGGKSDSLNAAINVARHPLVCTIDADSILERDALLKMVRPFMTDTSTVAVGGIVRVANGCEIRRGENVEVRLPKSHLARFQIVEYLRAFLFGRVGLSRLRSLLVTSGAFSLLDKQAVIECGGYRRESVGEDMEVICRLHRRMHELGRDYRITFVPDPVCWTHVPEDFRSLARQRNRWHRGLMGALGREIGMLLNPRYGVIGLFAMPYFFFFEMLGPLIELSGYFTVGMAWYLGALDPQFALLFAVVAVLFGSVLSVTAVCLEELSFRRYPRWSHIFRLLAYGALENFGYRQLTLVWRLKATVDYLRGEREWEPRKAADRATPAGGAPRTA